MLCFWGIFCSQMLHLWLRVYIFIGIFNCRKKYNFISRLSKVILLNENLAFLSASLFAITPASLFMSVGYSFFNLLLIYFRYTEAFFAFFSFVGLYSFHIGHFFTASFLLSVTTSIRSNGILYAGFFLYDCIKSRKFGSCLRNVLCTLVIVAPYIIFQFYGLRNCTSEFQDSPPYCHSFFPNVYSHVQSKYWYV